MKKQEKTRKEENRSLGEREKARASSFQKMSEDLRKQGYRQYSLSVGTDRANRFALTMARPVFGLFLVIYMIVNPGSLGFRSLSDTLLFAGGLILLLILREFIRGLVWSLFAGNGLKDMEFGYLRDTLTPYCTCHVPLKKNGYILGMLMPLIVTGIIPAVTGIVIGSFPLLLIGTVMIIWSAGDILLVFTLLKHKSGSADQLVCDLPLQAGCMLFERQDKRNGK